MKVKLIIPGKSTGMACPDGQIFEVDSISHDMRILAPREYRIFGLSPEWVVELKEDKFDKLYLTLKDESKG